MFGSFCIGFIDFMLKGKCLLDYTNLFSSNEYEKNDKMILRQVQQLKRLRWKNYITLFVVSIKNLKYHKTLNIMHIRKNITVVFFYYLQ